MWAYLVAFNPPAQCDFSTMKSLCVEQPPKQSCITFIFLERGTLSLDWLTFLAWRNVNGGDGIVVQKGRGWVDWKHWSLSLTSRQSHTPKACVMRFLRFPPLGAFFSIVYFFCVYIRPYIKPKICRRLWYVAVVKSHTADMWQHATVYIWLSVDISKIYLPLH